LSTFTENRIVHWGDCAPSGAVFYPVYFRWFDEATWNLFASLGLPIDTLGARFGVVGLPLLANNCEYQRPCRLGDNLAVSSSIASLDKKLIVVKHCIVNAGQSAVVSSERRFWGVRHAADPGRLQKGTIPPEVLTILAAATATAASS
jgi:YbgC/YbaW family acyl-CoA thioester hydrolase